MNDQLLVAYLAGIFDGDTVIDITAPPTFSPSPPRADTAREG